MEEFSFPIIRILILISKSPPAVFELILLSFPWLRIVLGTFIDLSNCEVLGTFIDLSNCEGTSVTVTVTLPRVGGGWVLL